VPPFSTDDNYSLLQKIAVLEMKINRLEVNVEVNGLCGNETTTLHYHKSSNNNPPWNCLGAKLKSKSCLLKVGGSETDWPSLPTRQRISPTPVYGRKQDWTSVNGKVNNKPLNHRV